MISLIKRGIEKNCHWNSKPSVATKQIRTFSRLLLNVLKNYCHHGIYLHHFQSLFINFFNVIAYEI